MKTDQIDGFLGVSVGSPYYSKARLADYLSWAEINLNRFAFLIGDFLYTFNAKVFKHLDQAEATKRAKEIGDNLEVAIRGLERFNGFVEIVRWADFINNDQYNYYLRRCQVEYANQATFKKSVREQVWMNLGTRAAITGLSRDSAVDNAASEALDTYVLHEIAGLIFMSENEGYPLEIYPGEDLKILVEIYEGKYPALRKMLPPKPQRQFLSLTLD